MRYLCVQCDEKFETDEDKPRCPKCMRVHGIHPLDGDDQPPANVKDADAGDADADVGAKAADAGDANADAGEGESPQAGGGAGGAGEKRAAAKRSESPEGQISGGTVAAVSVLVVIAVAAIVMSGEKDGEGAETAVAGAGVSEGLTPSLASDPMAKLVVADGAIDAFAREATAGKADGVAKGQAIVAALRAKAAEGAFVGWSMAEPRSTAPMTAAEAYALIAKGDARAELYPLEVASVAVAAMRSAGVKAQLVEIYAFEGDRSPPDPSGRFGYYGVLVGEGAGQKLLDPYAGREVPVAPADQVALTDAQAVAAGVSLRSSYLAQPTGDVAAALRDAEAALKLLPGSPTVRTAHAYALLAGGAGMPGLRELEAAQQQRDDAPRNLNVGFARMAGGQFSSAAKHIARALEIAPDYALGHLNLARMHMAQGDRPMARASLERAEQLDPKMPLVALAWAGYHLSGGELQEALARSEQAVEDRPRSAEARITLAQVQRALGRYDDMRKQARALLELVAPSQRERTRQLIGAALGPTALEAPSDEEAAGPATTDGGVPDSPNAAFDLTKGSKLLGGGGKAMPSLAGEDMKLELKR